MKPTTNELTFQLETKQSSIDAATLTTGANTATNLNNNNNSNSRKKSFEIINFWNYFRAKHSPNQTNACKLITSSLVVSEPTNKHRCQRGSSISENVFRSILQSPELVVHCNDTDKCSSGEDGACDIVGVSNRKFRQQRNSAPTIIHKDKMEKTWERLMKLKSNEKKVKRMTSRSKLQNWVAQHSGFSGVSAASDIEENFPHTQNKNTIDRKSNNFLGYTNDQEEAVANNSDRKNQSGSGTVSNVVVIIDTPVQATINDYLTKTSRTKMKPTKSAISGFKLQSTSHKNCFRKRRFSVDSNIQISHCYTPENMPQIQIERVESSPEHQNNQYSYYPYDCNQLPERQSMEFAGKVSNISTATQPATLNESSSHLANVYRRNSLVNLVHYSEDTIKEESNSDSEINECQPNYLDQAITNSNDTMSVISDQISASNTTVAASLITATSSGNGSIIDDCTNPGAGKKERVNSSVTSSHSNRHLSASGTEYDCDYDQPRRGSIKESTEERLDNDNDNLFEGEDGIIDLFPNVAKLSSDVSEKYYLPRQWRKPDSYSSYSSLNNDECSVSLNSQDGNSNTTASNYHNANNNSNKQSSQIFETRQMEIRPPINYPRKYSLTVPGEPRHMRTLHRRESGSRSPLNSSCGGLSPSELSTPSPSCSNSINDDQSSCSSGGLNTIPIELSRKCTLSVDSLLLRTSSSTNREHHKTLANNKKDLNRLDELCRRLFHLRTNSAASSSNSHHSREFVNSLSPTCKEFDDESDTFKEAPKVPKKRKDSMTAMIASMLLPDSICQKIGASFSTDRINQQQNQQYSPHSSNSPSTSRSISSRNIFTSKGKTTSSNHHHQSKAERRSDTSSTAGPPETPPPTVERSRKGSIVQLTSASAGKIVRLLRRTHSAGCSKDVPSHALFLNTENKAERKKRQRKERKAKRGHRKQAPALEDMKQRLRFLRRRHTDSSLHSSTVRPSRDEVEKWSKSFRDLMANRYGSALFRAFLSREYSEENIEFWIACEEYRKARSSKLPHKAKKIFNNFLDVQSPKEVNLDPKIRMEIQQNLATPSKNTFDEAQRKIQGLLESDSYVRFLRSDLYTDLVISEIERNAQELNDNNNNNENADAKSMPLSPESCSNALVNSISSSIVNQ